MKGFSQVYRSLAFYIHLLAVTGNVVVHRSSFFSVRLCIVILNMHFKDIFNFLLFCVIFGIDTFAAGSGKLPQCEHWKKENVTSCFDQNPDSDTTIFFPTIAFHANDMDFCLVKMSFQTHNHERGRSKNRFQFEGVIQWGVNYTMDRYSFLMSTIDRDIGANFTFVISATSSRDYGVYEISLMKQSTYSENIVILQHKYVLSNIHSPLPFPECNMVAGTSSTIQEDLSMTCSVFGYFFPPVTVNVFVTSLEENCSVDTRDERSAGIHLVTTKTTDCENVTFTCVTNQSRTDLATNFSWSCAIDVTSAMSDTTTDLDMQSKSSIMNLTEVKVLLLITIPSIIAINLVCWLCFVVSKRRENKRVVGRSVTNESMNLTNITHTSSIHGNEKSIAAAVDIDIAKETFSDEIYENNFELDGDNNSAEMVYDDV